MQAVTAVQLIQIISMVNTRVTNDAKCMSEWGVETDLVAEKPWVSIQNENRKTEKDIQVLHKEKTSWDSHQEFGIAVPYSFLSLVWAEWCTGSYREPKVGMVVENGVKMLLKEILKCSWLKCTQWSMCIIQRSYKVTCSQFHSLLMA